MIKVESEFLCIIYLIENHKTEMLKSSYTPLLFHLSDYILKRLDKFLQVK